MRSFYREAVSGASFVASDFGRVDSARERFGDERCVKCGSAMIQLVGMSVSSEAAGESRRIWPEEWRVHCPKIAAVLDRIPQFWEYYWTKDSINEFVLAGRWQAWGFGKE